MPAAATGLQDLAAVEAQSFDQAPHRLDQVGVGVVRVQGVVPGGEPLRFVQQLSQLGREAGQVIRRVVLEDLRDRAPAGPASEDLLLVRRRRPVLGLQLPQQPERGQVVADPGDRPGPRKILLPGRPEARGRLGGRRAPEDQLAVRQASISRCSVPASFSR
ncbi:hypothetical protein GCM10010505_69810 [Kitasatospora aburaviensis]